MAKKVQVIATLLVMNFLFFTFANACNSCHSPPPRPPPPRTPPPSGGSGGGVSCPPPPPRTPPPSGGSGGGVSCPPPPPNGGGGGNNNNNNNTTCPINALKLGVCAVVLNGLINATLGSPPRLPCCPLIQGLLNLEAAVCLCIALEASILGINLDVPIALSLVLNYCGGSAPSGFQCPNSLTASSSGNPRVILG